MRDQRAAWTGRQDDVHEPVAWHRFTPWTTSLVVVEVDRLNVQALS